MMHLHYFHQDCVVASSRLLVDSDTLPLVHRVVNDIDASARQHAARIVGLPGLVVRGARVGVINMMIDRRGRRLNNARAFNQLTFKNVVGNGPSLKLFRNGAVQGAGFSTEAHFGEFVNSIAGYLDLPLIDPAATRLNLVAGSARIDGGLNMRAFRDDMVQLGFSVRWDPNTGNNGAKVDVPDVDGDRSALVFSSGFIKLFAKSEDQLIRMVNTLDGMVAQVF